MLQRAALKDSIDIDIAHKKFSIMDHSIVLHQKWVGKSSKSKGVVEFEDAFQVLTTFAASEPAVPVKSVVVWTDYLEVQARVAHIFILRQTHEHFGHAPPTHLTFC